MIHPKSLRGGLALVAMCACALWVCVLTIMLNLVLGSQLRSQADSLLRVRADAAAATVSLDAGGNATVREPPNDAALDAGIWIFQGTRPLKAPHSSAMVNLAAQHLIGIGRRYVNVGNGSPVRLYAHPIIRNGTQVGTIVTATSLDPYRRTARSALLASSALALLFVGGVYIVTRRVVGRALLPVAHMAEQAAQWSAHDVTQRFGEAARPSELRELAANLDSLLNHIGAALRHEQQMAAELSHELKTPLSVIVAENDLLLAHIPNDSGRAQGHEVIAKTADRMNLLLDTLLVEAGQRITEAPGRCALRPVILAAMSDSRENSGMRHTTTTMDVLPFDLEVGVSREVVQRILTPLLGNAQRYAHSQIAVHAHRIQGNIEIVVSDDGPGVPAAFRDNLFEPGGRAEPGDGHPGPGLGLALARRLARSSGGDMSLQDSQVGAAFAVVLPAG
jgi:signal transduction histidine kinase